jgi:hypothetical protein
VVGGARQQFGRCGCTIEPERADCFQLAEHDRKVLLHEHAPTGLQIVDQPELSDALALPGLPCCFRVTRRRLVPVEHHDVQPLSCQQDR